MVDVHLNRLNCFHFLILKIGLLIILMGCMIFLSPFLHVATITMSTVSFIAQLDSELSANRKIKFFSLAAYDSGFLRSRSLFAKQIQVTASEVQPISVVKFSCPKTGDSLRSLFVISTIGTTKPMSYFCIC